MISLYEASVENYLRVVGATIKILKKSESFFQEVGQTPDGFVSFQLVPDMLPFSFQVYSVAHHSLHAAQGLLEGSFGPSKDLPEKDFAGLIQVLEESKQKLKAISKDEINSRFGETVVFRMGKLELPFTAESFVHSFSIPNLYFHATTTYNMMRMNGVPLGKADFMGAMKINFPS